jgi:hypothetical protein
MVYPSCYFIHSPNTFLDIFNRFLYIKTAFRVLGCPRPYISYMCCVVLSVGHRLQSSVFDELRWANLHFSSKPCIELRLCALVHTSGIYWILQCSICHTDIEYYTQTHTVSPAEPLCPV